MKFTITLFLGIFLLVACASTQNGGTSSKQKEVFTVHGNCGMCKKTIEGSVENVSGVYYAYWDAESDEMTIRFNPQVITLEEIKQRIANVGYDSDTHRATNEAYNNLHGCCKYERP